MPRPATPWRGTVRPVWIDGEAKAAPRPTLLDEAAVSVGCPIWVCLGDRQDTWKQGVITRVTYATVYVRLLD